MQNRKKKKNGNGFGQSLELRVGLPSPSLPQSLIKKKFHLGRGGARMEKRKKENCPGDSSQRTGD